MALLVAACGSKAGDDDPVKRAKAAVAQGDPGLAFIELRNAIKSKPENTEARLLLARLLIEMGDPAAARRELAQAEKLGAPPAEVATLTADATLAAGDAKGLLEQLADGRLKLPSAEASEFRGRAYFAQGRAAEARAQFEGALLVAPSSAEARLGLAQALLAQGQREAAMKEIDTLLKAPAAAPTAHLMRAVMLMRLGRFADAEQDFVQAQAGPPDSLSFSRRLMLFGGLVEARLAQQKVAEAQAAQAELGRLAPESRITRLLGARVALVSGKTSEGVAELQRLVTVDPQFLQARLLLGRALLVQGNRQQAQAQIEAVVSAIPDNPEALLLLAQARAGQGGTEPRPNPLILNNLAWKYYLDGDDRAEATARQAYELAPLNAAIADTYGWILLEKKSTARGAALLAYAATLAARDPEIQYHHAVALAATGRGADARAILQWLLTPDARFARPEQARKLLETLPG